MSKTKQFFNQIDNLNHNTDQNHLNDLYVYAFLNQEDLIDIYMFNNSATLEDCIKVKQAVLKPITSTGSYALFLWNLINSNIEEFYSLTDITKEEFKQIAATCIKKYTINNALSNSDIKKPFINLSGGHQSLATFNMLYENKCLSYEDNNELKIMRNQNAVYYPPNKYSVPEVIKRQQMSYQQLSQLNSDEAIRTLKKVD